MAKDLYGDYTPLVSRHVVLTQSGRDVSIRIEDTTAGATRQDTTDGATGDEAYNCDRYGADIKTMFGVKVDDNIWKYLDNDHGKDREAKTFLQLFKQGKIEEIRKMKSFVNNNNEMYDVWRMPKTALQIASEKGCFQMVNLLKDADKISIDEKIYDATDDVEEKVSQEVRKMFAKANPAYLCLKEKDPVMSALQWPLKFQEVFGPTNTLPILRDRYLGYKRQLTQFTEEILDCCLTHVEVRKLLDGKDRAELLNGKDRANGDVFLHDTLKLANDAVRLRGKGFVAHRKTQLELQRRWLDGQPKYFRWSGNSWFWFFLYHFCCWLFYGLLFPVLPVVYALPRTRRLISSPKGKFLAEQFSAIFFLVALFVYEVLDCHHPILFFFLLSWILGSLVCELIQLKTYGPLHYFKNIWNILDLLVLISFAAGVILRDYFIMSGSHFLLFLEKLPALTLVCAMLRRMQTFYLSELVGKMFLIFMEMKTEVCRFLVIFGYVVLAFACSFYFLYYDVRDGIFRPFLNFHTSLLHLTMKVFSETNNIEYLQLLNQNITVGAAQRNGTAVLDAGSIYDLAGFTLYTVFLTMAILILLKLCVAMMTNKYSILQKNIQKLWYLKRSEIWLYYIRQKIIFPPPYNLLEIFVRILLDFTRRSQQAVCKANASGEPVQANTSGEPVKEVKIEMTKNNTEQEDFEPSYEENNTEQEDRTKS